jgi:TolA-binding protein
MIMKEPTRKYLVRMVTLLLAGSVVACASPPAAAPVQQLPPTAPAGASVSSIAQPIAAGEPEAAAAQQTCDLFRQMIEGIDTLTTGQQQDLVDQMADVVQGSGDAELMYAVVEFAQGYLESNPKLFAYGMRRMSALCNVPYQ